MDKILESPTKYAKKEKIKSRSLQSRIGQPHFPKHDSVNNFT